MLTLRNSHWDNHFIIKKVQQHNFYVTILVTILKWQIVRGKKIVMSQLFIIYHFRVVVKIMFSVNNFFY
jgi:hypothetical protein